MNYYCNPININYKYQFNKNTTDDLITVSREAADPSMIMFKERYYIFPSMTCGFLYSDNMAEWNFHSLKSIPVYDYAPDVRVVGDYVYFCASNHGHGTFYRTKDLFADNFEEVKGTFPFWDPNLFADDDGRIYLYWGSSTTLPLYGIELNSDDMSPIGEKKELIYGNDKENGYERSGENHIPAHSPEQIEELLKSLEDPNNDIPMEMKEAARAYITCAPYIEGVWMTKYNGIYYLQYASPSSRNNIYADGVYIGENPLGPFNLAKNNPYSYKPGGFIPGAGHGSSMEDRFGSLWHIATMRICMNHNFERRLGLWPAGWDSDGDMFCNQSYGDWPTNIDKIKHDPWAKPEWMLLSYAKKAKASSSVVGYKPENITDENIQTWWKATTNKPGQWIEVDLEKEYDVHAIQINFADDHLILPLPKGAQLTDALLQNRWIDETPQATRWRLEGSLDGKDYFIIEDKYDADTDLPHDLIVRKEGIKARYIKLTINSLPYDQTPCVSGLRVFGLGKGNPPVKATDISVKLVSDLDIDVSWKGSGTGYIVEWGYAPNKLYHSYQIFNKKVRVGGLVKSQDIYLRIVSFNDNGITEGDIIKV